MKTPTESPRFVAPGPVLVAPTDDRGPYSFEEFIKTFAEHPKDQAGPRVQVHNLAFRRAPRAVIEADGTVRVSGTSDRNIVGGRVDYGPRLRSFDIPRRILRRAVPLLTKDDGAFEALVPLRTLFGKKYDLGVRRSGRGTLALRIRVLDKALGAERTEDLDVAYRCPGGCSEDSEVVQLPSFIVGPVVDLVDERSAVVSFETDVATVGRVIAFDGVAALRFDSASPARRHAVELSGLTAGTAYRVLVLAMDGRREISEALESAIYTEPDDATYFRFAVMSDSRAGVGGPQHKVRGSNRAALQALSAHALRRGSRFVVFAGDLINGYTTEPEAYRFELQGFIQSIQPYASRMPFFEGMGNHELLMDAWSGGFLSNRTDGPNSESVFAESFVNPLNGPPAEEGRPTYRENVYSFDYGTVHVAMVNSNYDYRSHIEDPAHPRYGTGVREGTLTRAQLEWLDQDLADARNRGLRHLIVATHEPAYPAAGHVHDAMYWNGEIPEVLETRDRFWSLLVKHRVLAAVFGDEHAYTRSLIDEHVDPRWTHAIWHIVTGGAGAPYYALDESVPWSKAIQAYQPVVHYCEFDVQGPTVVLRAVDDEGRIIDEVTLTTTP
ncbi:MAG: metallophosphoesterase [Myxococcota bacterium]